MYQKQGHFRRGDFEGKLSVFAKDWSIVLLHPQYPNPKTEAVWWRGRIFQITIQQYLEKDHYKELGKYDLFFVLSQFLYLQKKMFIPKRRIGIFLNWCLIFLWWFVHFHNTVRLCTALGWAQLHSSYHFDQEPSVPGRFVYAQVVWCWRVWICLKKRK